MRMPRKCGRGLWFGGQFFDPLSGGVGVQDLLKLGLMRSKRAVGVLTVETLARYGGGSSSRGAPRRCESDTLAGMATVDLAGQSLGHVSSVAQPGHSFRL